MTAMSPREKQAAYRARIAAKLERLERYEGALERCEEALRQIAEFGESWSSYVASHALDHVLDDKSRN